jgi:hypothetical protein
LALARTFQAQKTHPASPNAVAVGDFNGDGKPDLVVTNPGGNTFGVLLGNGDGSFQTQQNYTIGIPVLHSKTLYFVLEEGSSFIPHKSVRPAISA